VSRLYYPRSDADATLVSGKDTASEYLEKMVKMIPSEIVTLYIFLLGFVPKVEIVPDDNKIFLYGTIFFLCLVLTPTYLYSIADKTKKYKLHLAYSTLAFIIWAYTISAGTIIPDFYDPALASIIIAIFTAMSSLFPM
jgi:hypothetical protein